MTFSVSRFPPRVSHRFFFLLSGSRARHQRQEALPLEVQKTFHSFSHHINLPEAREHQRLEQLAADAPGADAEYPRGRDARGELGRAAGAGAADASLERRAPEGVGLGRRWDHFARSMLSFLSFFSVDRKSYFFFIFFFFFLSLTSLTTFLLFVSLPFSSHPGPCDTTRRHPGHRLSCFSPSPDRNGERKAWRTREGAEKKSIAR